MSRTFGGTMRVSFARCFVVGLIAGLVGVALTTGAAPPSVRAVGSAAGTEHTITLNGVGRVSLTPDVATIQLGVSITRPTAGAAVTAGAAAMNQVVSAIRRAGIADRDIQTAALSLQAVYSNAGRLTGFQLSNEVSVVAHDLARLGSLIDAAVAAGATTVDGVSFGVADPTTAERSARTAAVADARAKADTLAAAAGVSILGVSSINETTGPVPLAQADAGGTTPILPGTAEISVAVTITYLIG